jgi:phosphate transport system substrate-binding protein
VDAGGGPRPPSRITVENGTYQPLARPLFLYVNAHSAGRPGVRAFVQAFLTHAGRFASEVGFVPLPAESYALGATYFRDGRVGTVFSEAGSSGLPLIEALHNKAAL